MEDCTQPIPVVVNYERLEAPSNHLVHRSSHLKVIKPNDGEKIAAGLPTVSIINARSLFPKLESLVSHFQETATDVAIISEVWGKNSKSELYKIKELLEMRGIDFIYDIRTDKRGGGTAVAVSAELFTMSRITLPKVKGLEVTTVMIKNKISQVTNRPIIIFSALALSTRMPYWTS